MPKVTAGTKFKLEEGNLYVVYRILSSVFMINQNDLMPPIHLKNHVIIEPLGYYETRGEAEEVWMRAVKREDAAWHEDGWGPDYDLE